jgi:hypothetical protein
MRSTVTYGAETWKFNKNLESKLMSMIFLRDRTKITSNVIREKKITKN